MSTIVWVVVGWVAASAAVIGGWIVGVLYAQHRQHRRRAPGIWLHR